MVADGLELDRLDCSSEERSEPAGTRPGRLPGLPGGRSLDEPEPEISDEVLDALLAGASSAQEIAGPDGVLAYLTRRLLNRVAGGGAVRASGV